MIQKHLAKFSFSIVLAAVFSLGFVTLTAHAAQSPPSCARRACSDPIITNLGTACHYYERSTGCDFRCFVGIDAYGACRHNCSPAL